MTAHAMLDRFQRNGVPGEEITPGPVITDREQPDREDGSEEVEGDEWGEFEDYDDDAYDYIDAGMVSDSTSLHDTRPSQHFCRAVCVRLRATASVP